MVLSKFLINKQINVNQNFRLPSVVYGILYNNGLLINQTSNNNLKILATNHSTLSSSNLNNLKNIIEKCNKTSVRWILKGGPGYTKFGHERFKPNLSKYAYFWYAFLFFGVNFVLFFDLENFVFRGQEPEHKIREYNSKYARDSQVGAKEISTDNNEMSTNEETDELDNLQVEENDSQKSKKISFRERKIIQYENRIRQYSTPDKIFRYFATLKIWNEKINDYEIFMTPEDFVRSITYGIKQPEGLGLDSYSKFDPNMQKLELKLDENSIFKRLSSHGLISFSDYLFLVTLLSTPTRHFEIAFHMFDLDGNGNIDLDEFDQLQQIIRNQTSTGQRHRDTHMTGSVIKGNSVLNNYFFGPNLDQLLTADKFTKFQKSLQSEVVRMEFNYTSRHFGKNGVRIIRETEFCEMILAYAGLPNSKTKKMLKHVSSIYNNNNDENSVGITLEEFETFFQVLRSIHDIDIALKFYSIAGASIDKGILKHVSKTVAEVDLSDHVIDVIFNLFDDNGDGKLSHREFIKVMKRRLARGLSSPKDTGFVNFVEALGSCTKDIFFTNK